LPGTLERQRHELAFQSCLGPALMASRGYAAPEVKQAYLRAQELCEQIGDTPRLFSVLWGLWLFSLARQELQMARWHASSGNSSAPWLHAPTMRLSPWRPIVRWATACSL
jgi:predicted ATPase